MVKLDNNENVLCFGKSNNINENGNVKVNPESLGVYFTSPTCLYFVSFELTLIKYYETMYKHQTSQKLPTGQSQAKAKPSQECHPSFRSYLRINGMTQNKPVKK